MLKVIMRMKYQFRLHSIFQELFLASILVSKCSFAMPVKLCKDEKKIDSQYRNFMEDLLSCIQIKTESSLSFVLFRHQR